MRAEPIVNGLEEEWGDSVQVVQLKMQEKENQALIERLDAIYTPTFVLFDASGKEVWRSVGQIDAYEVKDRVKALQES
jgi:thiol-disulfide isomerase/thioredoxin